MAEHHHRRSIRLPGYDYAQAGAYFFTVCAHQRECLLGEIRDGAMTLSAYGELVEACWRGLPAFFPRVELDAFVVMPNHIHGIIMIEDAPLGGAGGRLGGDQRWPGLPVGADRRPGADEGWPGPPVGADRRPGRGEASSGGRGAPRPPDDASPLPRGVAAGTCPGSLAAIIQNLKSVTARQINNLRETPRAPVWQRNYYEHVIRSEARLAQVRRYVLENPLRWDVDELHAG